MRCFALLLIVLAGCSRNAPPVAKAPAPAPVPAASTAAAPTAPALGMIRSGEPAFDELIKTLTADPGALKKYQNRTIDFTMTVETIKKGKDEYVATGKVGSVGMKVTFFTSEKSELNRPVHGLQPGHQVTFAGQIAAFRPGPPRPEITVESGAIMSVDSMPEDATKAKK